MIFLSIMLIGTLLSSAILFISFYFRYHQPSRRRLEADRKALVAFLDKAGRPLAPWGDNELELLCALHYPTPRRLGWKDRRSGLLKTIYDEPVVAWVYLHYKSKDPHYLMVLRMSGEPQPLALRIRDGCAFLFEGDRHIASCEGERLWVSPHQGREIARLVGSEGQSRVLRINGITAGILTYAPGSGSLKPRLFSWPESLTAEQARWAKIISACWLISRQERLSWGH